MNERQMEEFIETASCRGSVMGLDSIKNLLEKMDNPQDKLKYIHIAGTNGKGSTLAFISTVLKCAGYKVGRYISPVIREYREKIQINGRMISKKDILEGMSYIKEKCDELEKEGKAAPTIFEIETALAFWYFLKKSCDIVVLETGMGGKDDATNIIKAPIASVICHISMDHMAILGNTPAKIAEVKAGIIKNGSSVVIGRQLPEVEAVIQTACEKNNADLHIAGEASLVRAGRNILTLNYKGHKAVKIKLLGEYQLYNAAVALETIDLLAEKGFHIHEEAIMQGMCETEWYGRFSVICKKPLTVVDGAHNEAAAVQLMKSVHMYIKDVPLIYVMGVFRDKEYEKIIEITCPYAAHIVTLATPDNPRALSAIELAEAVRSVNPNVTAASSVEEAVEMAKLLAGDKCAIVAFGSLSFLGRIESCFKN